MFLRRAAGLLKKIRFPPRTVGRCAKPATPSSISLPSNTEPIYGYGFGFSTWRKDYGDLALWMILSGQAAVILAINGNLVLAEDASVAELGTGNETGEAYLTDLRRIEDGSVISNIHTSKWRIFTDNGRDLFLKGKLDEAEKYFLSALQEAKEGFGERDPHVASSCNNLAELCRVRKAFDKAEPLYLEAIDILEESFGPEDIRVGAALHNLGQFYLVQRKFEEARKCYERALKIKGRVLGYAHTDYADTMYHLGMVLHLQGKVKDSEALIRDSIRILEEGGFGESMTCIKRLRYLSQLLLNSNRLSEAENLQRKILHALELSKGWESLDTAIAAESLALTLQSVGSLRESEEILERCLAARKAILHEDDIQVGTNMLHLARLAMLNCNRLRKEDISKANMELHKAKLLLDDSIRRPLPLQGLGRVRCTHSYPCTQRGCFSISNLQSPGRNGLTLPLIARLVLDGAKENKSSPYSDVVAREKLKVGHAALIILLQSLDALALLEMTKFELQEGMEAYGTPPEAERALQQCFSVLKEPGIPSFLLSSSDVKGEYLSCLKHLVSLLSTSTSEKQSGPTLKELKDEIRRLESEISPNRKRRS